MTKHPGESVAGAATLPMLPAGVRGQSHPEPAEDRSWYLEGVKHAEILLQRREFDRARAILEKMLPRFGKRTSFERAAVTEQIGGCLLQEGNAPAASLAYREAVEIAASLPLGDGAKRLQCAAWSGLGDACRAAAQFARAREAYTTAIALAKELKDDRAQGIDLVHLGMLDLDECLFGQAIAAFGAALDIFQRHRDLPSQSIAHSRLGRALLGLGLTGEAEAQFRRAEELHTSGADHAGASQAALQLAAMATTAADAEPWYRKAVDAARQAESPLLVRQSQCALARHLLSVSGKRLEARRLLEEALGSVTLENFAGDVWDAYGMLADVLFAQAGESQSPLLRTQGLAFRQVSQSGPRLHATLLELGPEPSFGRAALAHRIARCFGLGNRYDLAIGSFHEAIGLIARLSASAAAQRLLVITHVDLAGALRLGKQAAEARTSYVRALAVAQETGELRAQCLVATCLAELAIEEERTDEAVAQAKDALQSARALRDRSSQIAALLVLGAACKAAELLSDAKACYVEASALCDAQGDSGGAEQARRRLQEIAGNTGAQATPIAEPGEPVAQVAAAFAASLRVDVTTDCVFGSDIVIELGEATTVLDVAGTPFSVGVETYPQLPPCARTYLGDDKHLCIEVPDGEPSYEAMPECVLMRRSRRLLTMSGPLGIAWKVLAALDGTRSLRDILMGVASGDRPAAQAFVDLLAAAALLDTSGRPVASFIHSATKKGALLGGGLKDDAVVGLVTDGGYRRFADAPQVPLTDVVPASMRPFHDLTRRRRSRRDYIGAEISQDELSAILGTACGVTGTMAWSGSEGEKQVKLRAYPSSGALYAVEIYPIVMRVHDLDAGVYHYCAPDSRLSRLRAHASDRHFLTAILPTERKMVAGAATMICLVGQFRRHEQKYGEGGYRMLVAEAGHISQTLVLAATALGLAARPFGGVFDQLLNRELGLDESDEQFLLSVVIGHAGE